MQPARSKLQRIRKHNATHSSTYKLGYMVGVLGHQSEDGEILHCLRILLDQSLLFPTIHTCQPEKHKHYEEYLPKLHQPLFNSSVMQKLSCWITYITMRLRSSFQTWVLERIHSSGKPINPWRDPDNRDRTLKLNTVLSELQVPNL